nr:reverse transcriptase domain-containing protein [Tanacetum cinerariifolium]
SLDEELAQKLYVKELAKEEARQEQERYNLEKALELQRHLDQRKENVPKGDQAKETDWNDPQYKDIKPLFKRIWDQVHTFVPKDSDIEREVMKRAGFDLQQGSLKRQRLDQQTKETEEEAKAQGDSDQEVQVISIYSDVLVESVRSSFSRVILIGFISVDVSVAPEGLAPPEIRQRRDILIRPGEDIPICRLYHTHLVGHAGHSPRGSHSSSDHSSSRHSSSGHSLSGHTPLDTTDADSSTTLRFVHPPLARTLRSEDSSFESSTGSSHKRCRAPAAIVTSPIHATRALVPSHAENIKAYAMAVEVTADRDVEARIDADIGMEVNVGIDVEDEVESSNIGTMEVRVDMVAGIDILDEILLQRIEDIETGQRDLEARSLIAALAAYEATRAANALEAENQSQNGSDDDNGNKGNGNGEDGNGRNENGGNGNPNENDRGARPVARECTYEDFMKCQPLNFNGTEGVVRQGHYMSDCPKLKDQNRGNKAGNKNEIGEARGKAYVLGGGDANPDSNVIKGTFLLNNHYDFVLFDLGADRSFVSTMFSTLLDVTPDTLDVSYAVELADERISKTNTVFRGCTLGLLGHPFNIDLMLVELGSFDVIIDMDWDDFCQNMFKPQG